MTNRDTSRVCVRGDLPEQHRNKFKEAWAWFLVTEDGIDDWPEDSKARRRAILPLIEAYQASRRNRS